MKRLLAFSFYDVGNSVFPMIVVSALTSSYFVNQVADNPQTGTGLWQLTIGIAGILIALLMPYIGTLADSVRRAIQLCNPLKVPTSGYERWKNMILNFDARDMLGG